MIFRGRNSFEMPSEKRTKVKKRSKRPRANTAEKRQKEVVGLTTAEATKLLEVG